MKEIDIEEAQTSLNELIDLAINGEEVIITKDKQCLVKLAPITPEKQHWTAYFGSAKAELWIADDFDEPVEKKDKLKNLTFKPDVIQGNPDDLVNISWEQEINFDLS